MYLISPWLHKRLSDYTLSGYRFGRACFSATLSTGRFYAIYLKALLVAVLIFLLVIASLALVLGLSGIVSIESLAAVGESGDAESNPALLIVIAIFYPVLFFASYLIKAYFRIRIRQHLFSHTLLDGRVSFESTMRMMPLWWLIISNLLLLVITLGFAYPWTKVRIVRYTVNNTVLHSASGLYAIVDDEHAYQLSIGEEIGDAFDMDMDIGF